MEIDFTKSYVQRYQTKSIINQRTVFDTNQYVVIALLQIINNQRHSSINNYRKKLNNNSITTH